jgi:cytochrome c2
MGARPFLRGPAARALGLAVLLGFGLLGAGCQAQTSALVQAVGDPHRGERLVDTQACGSCHIVPGHAVGWGRVGPPLTGFGRRTVIAGMLPNTPDNLVRWLQTPQAVKPRTAMPDMALSQGEARDIAAYLYTLQ